MEEHHDIPLPKLEDLIPDPATLDRMMDGAREYMEKAVPHPIVIGSRGEVYEQAVHALKHRQL